jgi:hypothetical protein
MAGVFCQTQSTGQMDLSPIAIRDYHNRRPRCSSFRLQLSGANSMTITCPGCQKKMAVKQDFFGKRVRCACGQTFRVGTPAAASVPASPPSVSPKPPAPAPPTAKSAPPASAPKAPPLPAESASHLDADLSSFSGMDLGSLLDEDIPLMDEPPPQRPAPAFGPPGALSADHLHDPLAAFGAPAAGGSRASSNGGRARGSGDDSPWQPSQNGLLSVAIVCLLFGIGGLILPMMGLQFKVLTLVGGDNPRVALGLAVAGAVMLFASQWRKPLLGGLFGTLALAVAVGVRSFAKGDAATDPTVDPEAWIPHPAQSRSESVTPDWQERMPVRELSHVAHSELLGGDGGGEFATVDPAERRLLGLRVQVKDFGGPSLGNIQPLFDPANPRDFNAVAAREGYVVAKLIVRYDEYVRAIKLVFGSLQGARSYPDPNDQYESDWIGNPEGDPNSDEPVREAVIDGSNQHIIGVCGREGLILDAVGLVYRD